MDREDEAIDAHDPEVEAPQAEQLALPSFEGLKPTGATVSFSGSVNVPSPAEAVSFEDGEVYFLVKGRVSGVAHRRKAKAGLVRDQATLVDEIVRVDEFEATGLFRRLLPTSTTSERHRDDDLGDQLSGDGEDLPVGE